MQRFMVSELFKNETARGPNWGHFFFENRKKSLFLHNLKPKFFGFNL